MTQRELQRLLTRHLTKNLRRVYRYSPIKRLAKAHHKGCVDCGSTRDLEYDHRPPVVPPDVNAEDMHPVEYFCRMFCIDQSTGDIELDNLVALCAPCHAKKTKGENSERAKNRTGPWSPAAIKRRNATRIRRQAKKAKRKKRRK